MAKNTKPLNEKTKEKLKSIQNKYIKDAKKQKDEGLVRFVTSCTRACKCPRK